MRLLKPPNFTLGSVITKGHSGGGRTHHKQTSNTPIRFVGVDGEGVTTPDGHSYVLLGVGQNQITNVDGLTWRESFDFLYQEYRPGTAYVGFYLGYDFTQILKSLPEGRARMLLTAEGMAVRKHRIPGKQPHPVECEGWHFDMLGSKRLRIRPKGCDCENATCKHKHDPWMYICDVGPFFQTSFLSVIDPKKWATGTEVVTDEEFALIEEGKKRRSTAVLDDNMMMYNRLENDILSRVMQTLDGGFHDIGIHLPASKWFGPGQAAQAWLKKEKVPTRIAHESLFVSPESTGGVAATEFFESARSSYFGGWFELFAHGIIPGTSYEYDINSAYPSVIADLPCLLHGEYTSGIGIPEVSDREICLVYGRIWSPGMPHRNPGQHVGAMLHRDSHGRILRPLATEGWFWWHELQAAQRAGVVKRLDNRGVQQIERWVKYDPCDCPPPMLGVRDLYQKRLEVGKDSPLGKGAKTVYNSDYGKFAQSVGDPVFGNPVYASLITSGCRCMDLDAIATHPDGLASLVMVATDAVYFMTPHPGLPMSDKLGEWDYKVKENLTLFKPGVYWDDKTRELIQRGESAQFKARGFKASDFAAQIGQVDDVFASWSTLPGRPRVWPSVSFVPTFSMVTGLQALRRNDWSLAGRVATGDEVKPLVQNADASDKRTGLYADTFDGRKVFRSLPHFGMDGVHWVKSHPYEKRFGMDDPWSQEYKEQLGVTQDGLVGDAIYDILKGQ